MSGIAASDSRSAGALTMIAFRVMIAVVPGRVASDLDLADVSPTPSPVLATMALVPGSTERAALRMSVHLDDNVDVVVATENIHLFDADTHEAIRSWMLEPAPRSTSASGHLLDLASCKGCAARRPRRVSLEVTQSCACDKALPTLAANQLSLRGDLCDGDRSVRNRARPSVR